MLPPQDGLDGVTHIIVDEVHERSVECDFLLTILRRMLTSYPHVKLVLMSATMHTNKLSSYFGGVPHIHIGGSVFPVQEFFLEHVLRFTDYLGGGAGGGGVGSSGAGAVRTPWQPCPKMHMWFDAR